MYLSTLIYVRIDADDLTVTIQSYREQFGAWWLGWPILMILLVIPALALALLPRRLPSEVKKFLKVLILRTNYFIVFIEFDLFFNKRLSSKPQHLFLTLPVALVLLPNQQFLMRRKNLVTLVSFLH